MSRARNDDDLMSMWGQTYALVVFGVLQTSGKGHPMSGTQEKWMTYSILAYPPSSRGCCYIRAENESGSIFATLKNSSP